MMSRLFIHQPEQEDIKELIYQVRCLGLLRYTESTFPRSHSFLNQGYSKQASEKYYQSGTYPGLHRSFPSASEIRIVLYEVLFDH